MQARWSIGQNLLYITSFKIPLQAKEPDESSIRKHKPYIWYILEFTALLLEKGIITAIRDLWIWTFGSSCSQEYCTDDTSERRYSDTL